MRGRIVAAIAVVWMGLLIVVAVGLQDQNLGWKLLPSVADDKNPFPVNDAIFAGGRKIFINKCVRCHGLKGEGDGEDVDIDLKKEMDLTRADRAAVNSDGIVFAKVWNGCQELKMPSFEDQLSKEQVWAVVAYAQTLRKK